MEFTIEEIKNYLLSKQSLEEAINDITDDAVVSCNENPEKVFYEKTVDALIKYQLQIGTYQLIEDHLKLRCGSNGTKGKKWMALTPAWITEEFKQSKNTKYDIAYWVNYGDGDTYGWFTVEQIIEWLSDPEVKLAQFGGVVEKLR